MATFSFMKSDVKRPVILWYSLMTAEHDLQSFLHLITQGECCPTCPNGPNCWIYGKIVVPSDGKQKMPGSTKEYYEYSFCNTDGSVKVCTVTTFRLGSYDYDFPMTECKLQ